MTWSNSLLGVSPVFLGLVRMYPSGEDPRGTGAKAQWSKHVFKPLLELVVKISWSKQDTRPSGKYILCSSGEGVKSDVH